MKGCLSVCLPCLAVRRCDAKRHGVVTDQTPPLRHHETNAESENNCKMPKATVCLALAALEVKYCQE